MLHICVACSLSVFLQRLVTKQELDTGCEEHKWSLFAVNIFRLSCRKLWQVPHTGVSSSPMVHGEGSVWLCIGLAKASRKGRAQWTALHPLSKSLTLSEPEGGLCHKSYTSRMVELQSGAECWHCTYCCCWQGIGYPGVAEQKHLFSRVWKAHTNGFPFLSSSEINCLPREASCASPASIYFGVKITMGRKHKRSQIT